VENPVVHDADLPFEIVRRNSHSIGCGRVSLFPHDDGVFTVRQIGSEFTLVVGNRFGCHFALDGVRPRVASLQVQVRADDDLGPGQGNFLGKGHLAFLLAGGAGAAQSGCEDTAGHPLLGERRLLQLTTDLPRSPQP
jgi:hypothetical protein